MVTVEKEPAIGKELEFYTRFPEEMDLLSDSEEFSETVRGHFDMPDDEYAALVSKVSEIVKGASSQAKAIADGYASKIKTIKAIKVLPITRQGSWRCKLDCLPKKGNPPSRSKVMTGLIICTHENQLTAFGWLWVRCVDRSRILEILKKDSENAVLLDVTPKGDAWDKHEICFIAEKILGVAENAESFDELVVRLAGPVLRITEERWSELFKLD